MDIKLTVAVLWELLYSDPKINYRVEVHHKLQNWNSGSETSPVQKKLTYNLGEIDLPRLKCIPSAIRSYIMPLYRREL